MIDFLRVFGEGHFGNYFILGFSCGALAFVAVTPTSICQMFGNADLTNWPGDRW